jgi:hypothetical protein
MGKNMAFDQQSNTKKRKMIAGSILGSIAVMYIIASFFVKEIAVFINLHPSNHVLKLLQYVFLGSGLFQLLYLPVILRRANKTNKQ